MAEHTSSVHVNLAALTFQPSTSSSALNTDYREGTPREFPKTGRVVMS